MDFHSFRLLWLFVDSCCVGNFLPDALVCLVSGDTGSEVARGDGERERERDACARELTSIDLIAAEVCSHYVSRVAALNVPREGLLVFFFKICVGKGHYKVHTETRVCRLNLV